MEDRKAHLLFHSLSDSHELHSKTPVVGLIFLLSLLGDDEVRLVTFQLHNTYFLFHFFSFERVNK